MESADARQRNDFHVAVPFPLHLVDKRRHTIDARIPGTDDADRLSLLRQLESLLGTGALTLHAGIYACC